MNIERLKEPFHPNEIEWRIGNQGKARNGIWAMAFAYVTNRAIMNRLDEVFGPMGWKNHFTQWKGDSQLCGISCYDETKAEWVTKWDGADDTQMEGTKGGLSDSMKRAAVEWGIGRYLYNLDATFVEVSMERPSKKDGWHKAYFKEEKTTYYWQTPRLPQWALPPRKEEK